MHFSLFSQEQSNSDNNCYFPNWAQFFFHGAKFKTLFSFHQKSVKKIIQYELMTSAFFLNVLDCLNVSDNCFKKTKEISSSNTMIITDYW